METEIWNTIAVAAEQQPQDETDDTIYNFGRILEEVEAEE